MYSSMQIDQICTASAASWGPRQKEEKIRGRGHVPSVPVG